jgi:ribosomal subunit interface protein
MKNISNKIKVNFNRVNPTNTIVNYISKRLKKRTFSKTTINEVDCDIIKRSDNGSKKFTIKVMVVINDTTMYFSEAGNDLYKMIDSILHKMQRKIALNVSPHSNYNLAIK